MNAGSAIASNAPEMIRSAASVAKICDTASHMRITPHIDVMDVAALSVRPEE